MYEFIEELNSGKLPEDPNMKWIGKDCEFVLHKEIYEHRSLRPSGEQNNLMSNYIEGEIIGFVKYILQDLDFFNIIKDGNCIYIGENGQGKYRLTRVCIREYRLTLDNLMSKIDCKLKANNFDKLTRVDYIGSGSHTIPKNIPSIIFEDIVIGEIDISRKNIKKIEIEMINDINKEKFITLYLRNIISKKYIEDQHNIKILIGKNILNANIYSVEFMTNLSIKFYIRDMEIN